MFKSYKLVFKFNSSHYIDSIENVHSHTFFIKLYLTPIENESVLYNKLEKKINLYLDNYKGNIINDFKEFATVKPTIENIGRVFFFIFRYLCEIDNVKLLRLEISDGPLETFCIGEKVIAGSIYNEINIPKMEKLIEKTARKIEV